MESHDINDFLRQPVDFLIVGGGTAGLVLANRLSENPDVRVGVIEAGPSRSGDPRVNQPTGAGMILNNTDYDWSYRSSPQAGARNRIFHIPRGKMLGGCSGINFMAYGRPCAQDVDDWSEKLGVSGWSWHDLFQYFKRSEKLELSEPNIQNRDHNDCPLDSSAHGLDGAIHTSIGTWQPPFEKSLMLALDEVSGLPRPREPYSGDHLGFYRSLFTTDRTKKPVRSYSYNGYLLPAAKRPNLITLTNALVCRVILECSGDGTQVAKGVELQYKAATYMVSATKEVILSAGSLQSPQLLELSGIGDPAVLLAAQIDCVLENENVGANLQEHTMSAVVYELAPGQMSIDSLFLDAALAGEHQRLYAESHTGALSGAVSLTGYIPYSSQVSVSALEETISSIETVSPLTQQNRVFQQRQQEAIRARMRQPRSADIQFIGSPANFDIAAGYSNCSKLLAGPPLGSNACYSLAVANMYPVSRGSVHVRSADPLHAPVIDPAFLSHPADVDVLAAGIAFADRAFQSPRIRDLVTRRISPAPEIDLQDRDSAREFARDCIVTYHHALGTCAMGQVVDGRLRIKGVQGLRVVDASVIPMQVSTAVLATVYAVAEKAAAMIKEDNSINTYV